MRRYFILRFKKILTKKKTKIEHDVEFRFFLDKIILRKFWRKFFIKMIV